MGRVPDDNINESDPEIMMDEDSNPVSCYICARPLFYTQPVFMVPVLTEVGFVAEPVGSCCVAKCNRTIAETKKQLEAEHAEVRRKQNEAVRESRRQFNRNLRGRL